MALVLLFLGVLRPTFRSLVGREAEEKKADAATEAESGAANDNKDGVPVAVPAEQYAAPQPMEMDDLLLLSAPQSYEKRLEYVQRLVDEDPKLVAQVIKSWVRDG